MVAMFIYSVNKLELIVSYYGLFYRSNLMRELIVILDAGLIHVPRMIDRYKNKTVVSLNIIMFELCLISSIRCLILNLVWCLLITAFNNY